MPTLRRMRASDADRVLAIFREGLATGHATFETEAPSWEAWDRSHLDRFRFVTEEEGRIVGWAALSPVSERCVYAGVAEVSVYVAERARGRGIGLELLDALVRAAEDGGLWSLQAGIFPENEASLRLHEAAGFRVVGRRERLGRLHGRWRDVLLLERRSDVTGVD